MILKFEKITNGFIGLRMRQQNQKHFPELINAMFIIYYGLKPVANDIEHLRRSTCKMCTAQASCNNHNVVLSQQKKPKRRYILQNNSCRRMQEAG